MRNLAGDKHSDASIADELEAAGIEIVKVPAYGEPRATLAGRLGRFEFHRAWYYWAVSGPMPISVALELYDDPIGVKAVRSGGHCGCPNPLTYGVRWYTPDGKPIYSEKFTPAQRESKVVGPIIDKIESECVHAEYPSTYPGAVGIVDCYHIDSARGLRLFADTIRKHGLDAAP